MFVPSLVFCFLFLPSLTMLFKSFMSIITKFDAKLATKSYPFIGDYISFYNNHDRFTQWTSDLVRNSPTLTTLLRQPFGQNRVITANPIVVKHILKTKFSIYTKGDIFRDTLFDFLGDGIFNIDGDEWKFQRQISSYEFSTKSLRHFVEHVVDTELNERLIPILKTAVANDSIIDLQDILQRFTFDNICEIAFGYDPKYLTPSLPESKFAVALDDAVRISPQRFNAITPMIWKIKRYLNIGSEKRLKEAVLEIREFAIKILNQRKEEIITDKSSNSNQFTDLLSRFISSCHDSSERLLVDIVISFILAGRDTTSSGLTWFFSLLLNSPHVENEIVKEIKEKSDNSIYDEVKDMVYTHASLCEAMRLYPPVPIDTKIARADDVLPDGTAVKKGMKVTYHPYAMGRVEKLWGKDWMEFRPERWLEKDETTEKLRFNARDQYIYPVFQAGPRVCLGKEMAFLQMKRVVAGILRQFKVVSMVEHVGEHVIAPGLTSKMKGGLLVKIKERK